MKTKSPVRKHGKAKTGKELSPRQVSLIVMACSGLGNSEIATELGLKMATVKWHFYMLFSSLKIARRDQLEENKIKSIFIGSKEIFYYE